MGDGVENSNLPAERLVSARDNFRVCVLGKFFSRAAILLLPIVLSACASSDDGKSITFTDDRGVSDQPFPGSYRTEILAFMRTYLNNPAGVRDAALADPVQRTIGGRLRYVSCLRYTARESDGSYREPRERAVLFVDGGSTASSKTPASPAPGWPTRRFRNWKR